MTYEDWLELARRDPRIVGVVLTGSRGREALVTERSDWDLRVIVRDGEEDYARSLETAHGSQVEVAATTVAGLGDWPEWDRYSFAHAQLAVDKLDGGVARLVAAIGSLGDAEARGLARETLGAYTNSLYRAVRNAQLDLDLEARLDACESVAALLTAVFALERRVRPFNKYLLWELVSHPLADWEGDELARLIESALDGGLDSQHVLFRAAEPRIRAHGHGDVIDDWEPHVELLRGSA
jgi:hypothetical protein